MAAIETTEPTAAPARRCEHLTKAGAPCTMPPLHGQTACMAHRKGAEDIRQRATSASAQKRRERREARRAARGRTAADWVAVALEARGQEIAEAVAQAAVDGDWRAAVALWERVYGKPVERSETVALDVDLRTLTDAQLADMRRRLLAECVPDVYREAS